jgi:hypothetical protein
MASTFDPDWTTWFTAEFESCPAGELEALTETAPPLPDSKS